MYREPNKTWVITEEELKELFAPVDWNKLYLNSLSEKEKIEDIKTNNKISKQRTFNSEIDKGN